MNTVIAPKTKETQDTPTSAEPMQEDTFSSQYEANIADGGEFLDDGIRMKDQPFHERMLKQDE